MNKRNLLMRYLLPTLFYSSYFLYVLLVVESSLIYHCLGRTLPYPTFRTSFSFFTDSAGKCGGAVEYLSALAAHLLHSNWAGALIYTFFGFSLWLLSRTIFSTSKNKFLTLLSYFPPIVLLVLSMSYNHQPVIILSILLGLLFFSGYIKLRPEVLAKALLLFVFMTAILFYLSPSACILFWIMATIYEVLDKKSVPVAVATIVLGFVTTLVGTLIFEIDMRPLLWSSAVTSSLFIGVKHSYSLFLLQVLFFFFPTLLIISKLLAKDSDNNRSPISWKVLAVQAVILICSCIAFIKPVFDGNSKWSHKVSFLAREEKWKELLEFVEQNPTTKRIEPETGCEIIIALHCTGRLADELLDWPENLNVSGINYPSQNYLWNQITSNGQFQLEMGVVGYSERLTAEKMTSRREQPIFVERIALINMVKGNLETARVYLNMLKDDLNYSDRGEMWLKLLESDPTLESNARVSSLRSMISDNISTYYDQLKFKPMDYLNKNPQNKAAREFLVCKLLLSGDLDNFVRSLAYYKSFKGDTLPKTYDQALALYKLLGGKVDSKWKPSKYSLSQAKRFLEIFKQCKGNKGLFHQATNTEFGNSYFSYFFKLKQG